MFLLLFIGVVSCSSRYESFECDKNSRNSDFGKLILTGPQMLNSDHFMGILKMSGIYAEGYTLMITGEKNVEADFIKKFNEMLNLNKLHANHVLGINDSIPVSRANRVAVENARLIFLALTSGDYHNAILDDDNFKDSFLKAWKSGATIVAVADGSDLLGENVVVPVVSDQGKESYGLQPGLNLIPGVTIDKASFFQEEKEWITQNLSSTDTFIGMGENSMVQFCGTEIVVIEPGSLMIWKNNKLYDRSFFQPKSKISLK